MFTFLFKKGFLVHYPFEHVLACQAEHCKAQCLGKMIKTQNFIPIIFLFKKGMFSFFPNQRKTGAVVYCEHGMVHIKEL